MYKHQYNFNIEIPKSLISKEKHNKIDLKPIDNKVVIGLMGYAKSGKDTIAKKFIDGYGFHRIAFADNLKKEMNENLKELVYNDICNENISINDIDFFTEDINLKKILRPYIIWYGEKIREINGDYYWINKALKKDAHGYNNIIISDVRRIKELDIFINSNSFKKRSETNFKLLNASTKELNTQLNNYSSLLFHVSQLHLTDNDNLTHDCIRFAQENWILDHTFYVDPRLPNNGSYRNNSINNQIKEVVKKFHINKPDKTIAYGRQISILD